MYLEFMVEQPRNCDVAAYLHALLTKSLQLKHCIPNLFYLSACMKYIVKMKCSYIAGSENMFLFFLWHGDVPSNNVISKMVKNFSNAIHQKL